MRFEEFLMLSNKELEIPYLKELTGKNRDGITQKQKDCLHRFGIGYTGLRYKKQASLVIGYAIERENNHMATPAQMRHLHRIGVPNVCDLTYKEAWCLINGCEPDMFEEFTIVFMFDTNSGKDWKITETDKEAAHERFKFLKEHGATNIRYKVL